MTEMTAAEGKRRVSLLLEGLAKAFIFQEGMPDRMRCGGSEEAGNGKVVVQDRNGKQEVFRFRSMQEARELLAWILEERPDLSAVHKRKNQEGFVH